MNYEELVKALRYCAESGDFNCNKDCPMYPNYPKCLTKMDMDAAAAIEELQSILTEADKKQAYQHDYICELVAEKEELQAETERLKAQLPKRGEWVRVEDGDSYHYECSRCGERPLYSRYGDVVLSGVCPMCGAANMEVQDA